MADIDVLATLPKTRRDILLLLKRRVRATIAELARELAMTHEGVRSHMLQLQQDGWISAECESGDDVDPRSPSGRPPVRYCLSLAGEHVFPKKYDDLTALLLQAALKMTSEEGLLELLATVTDIRVRAARSSDHAIESLYLKNDPFIETARREGDVVIIERNCPYLQVAIEQPAICATTVSAMRRLTGHEVVRERRFQDGDGRCEFRIMSERPLKRPRRFAPEPPKDAARR